MKLFKLLTAALVAFTVLFMTGCDRISPGNVGVKVDSWGGGKGVQTEVVGVGYYFSGPWTSYYEFPTSTQNYTWAHVKDGRDESITFQSSEGMVINADVGISYSIEADKAALVFQKYRKGIDEITNLYIRNMVRDALTTNASKMTVEQIYGVNRADLMNQVQKEVSDEVKAIGINVEKVYWVSSLRLPQQIVESINAKTNATQMTLQRENEVAQAKAEAQKKVAEAEGEAQSKLLIAKAESESIRMRAEALRANAELVEMTRAEAQREAVQKWDGKLPTQMVPGSAVPFINVGK